MLRKTFTVLISALLMVGALATPAANAAPQNIVMFGDSMWANGTGTFPAQMAELWQGPGKVTGNAPNEGRCRRGEARIAVNLQRQTGVKVEDYACNGAVAYAPANEDNNLKRQVDQALRQGSLNRSTRAVFLSIGMLDNIWAPGIPDVQTRNFVGAVRPQVDRIKRAAPNAKIAFVGYPSMVDGIGNGCWFHVGLMDRVAIPVPFLRMAQDATHHWQRQTAKAAGVGFIDMEKATRGHGSCAAPSKRYISGLVDNTSTPYNLTTHYTAAGNEGMARILSRHI